jgi:hypothetical protein
MAGGFHLAGHEELRRNWGWLLLLGAVMIVLS